MVKHHMCSSCAAGEIDAPADVLLSYSDAEHPNLKRRQWLCQMHADLIAEDATAGIDPKTMPVAYARALASVKVLSVNPAPRG